MLIIFILFFGIIVALIIFANKDIDRKEAEKMNELRSRFESILQQNGLTSTNMYIDKRNETGIAYDEEAQSICIFNKHEGLAVSYTNIIQSEVIEDGIQVTKTFRGSQVGGALIGGALGGGVGAVIGGLSGSSSTSDKVRNLELKVIINDTNEPAHYIKFLNAIGEGSGVSKTLEPYRELYKEAIHWHSLLSVLIKRADEDSVAKVKDIGIPVKHSSVVNDLEKLVALRREGYITQLEFDTQKAKLLR